MNVSRWGMLSLSIAIIGSLSGCGVVNKVRARNELNDGAKAYKERKFNEAEAHFTQAMSLDPSQKLTETFMARTLHQQYLANRTQPDNLKKAEEAIRIYKDLLAANPNDEVTNDAVSNLIESVQGPPALEQWRQQRANNENISPANRTKAMTFLAADKYRCVNEITESAKETIEKGNEAVYVFKKPANPEDFIKAKQCADEGIALIDKALSLDQSKSSPWSYKASLLVQKSRLAEMDGNNADKERFLAESNVPKERFSKLSEEEAAKRDAEAKAKADAEAAS